jgi:ABC-type multidrug transport system fused ATPase/permease subunit
LFPVKGDRRSVVTFRHILDLIRPHRWTALAAIGLALSACALNLPIPILIQKLIDDSKSASIGLIVLYAFGLLAVFALQSSVNLASTCVTGEIGLAVVRDLRHQLYSRLQRLSLAYYDRTPAGAIIARLMDDVSAVQNLITTQTLAVLTDLGAAALILVWIFVQSAWLFFIVLAFAPVYVIIFRTYSHRIREETGAVRGQLDKIFGRLKEKIDGMLVVKTHAREQEEVKGFAEQISAAHRPRVRVAMLGAAFSNLSVAAGGIGASLVFAAGAFKVVNGSMSPGALVSASAMAGYLFGPISRLADLAAVFQQAAASIDRLGEILDQVPDVADPPEPVRLKRVSGSVVFDQVGFGYTPGRPVVWDIRLRIEPGMKVALVGPTGCGKSTLVHLLLRFYDPAWGEIRLDGVPLRHLALADLRREIGVVAQEPVIFHGSVADNIRYGCPDASDKQVEGAARAASVHDLVMRLPDNYQTVIGSGGYKLSLGERQRVAIARAFCKNPALIVLDEATSSLDFASEALVQAALADLLRGRTAFVIAHRLATVIDADLIVVMEGGLIVQCGSHRQLLADRDGLYRRFCLRQLTGTASNLPAGSVVPTPTLRANESLRPGELQTWQ